MGIFIPLAKIDEERRLVVGRAAQEVPDKSGEIMDYASGRRAFEKWSREIEQASGGRSLGNVRSMHNARITAGKVTQIDYLDDEKAIDVCVKVVDDQEWKKVMEGVYTGFSIGGGYEPGSKRREGGLTRYTPIIQELSLVDNPCQPTARFAELHKADGTYARHELIGRIRGFGEIHAMRPRSFAEIHAETLDAIPFADMLAAHRARH